MPSLEINDDFFYDYKNTAAQKSNGDFLGIFVADKYFKLLIIIIGLGLTTLITKAIYLQGVKGSEYLYLAEGNRSRIERLEAFRGIIYDSKKKPLVKNEPIFEATIIPSALPSDLKEREFSIDNIATKIGMNSFQLQDILSAYPFWHKQPIVVKADLSYEEALEIKMAGTSSSSLNLEIANQRTYQDSIYFSHLIGYVGKINESELTSVDRAEYVISDYIGKSGLELYYEKDLRGNFGKRESEVNVSGRAQKIISEKPAIDGHDLILTIDSDFQKAVYDLTKSHLAKIGKNRASVVAIDPRDGAVRAMVSFPSYDNNKFAHGISSEEYQIYAQDKNNPLFNRSIKGEYPSGSTIKMIVGAAALDENIITEKTNILSTGGIWYDQRWFFPDWKTGGHGYTNIFKALSESVNTFFYQIGGGYKEFAGLGVNKLSEYFTKFGLGERSGIDIAGERKGLVPTPEWKKRVKNEDWYIGDTYHMSIGQGDVLVTPLQVANYTATIANGGTLYKPRIVNSIVDEDGREIFKPAEKIRDEIISDYNISLIQKGLRRTVIDGSAASLSFLPYEIAGKTGTAQFSDKYSPHAWFSGYAPYENPELAIAVLIEEGVEGSTFAVPLAGKIFEAYFQSQSALLDAEEKKL